MATKENEAPYQDPQEQPERKKYVFKKRDPVLAAKLESERVSNMKQSPFGNAKPREAVLAERTGKDEATVLKEEANTYGIHLKLTSAQFAEKKARQHEIDELKAVLASGGEEWDPEQLQADITNKESELEDLVKGFEALIVEQAKTGQGVRADRERKPFQQYNAMHQHSDGNFHRNGSAGSQYNHHNQGRSSNRGGFHPSAYEDSGSGREGGHGSNRGGFHPRAYEDSGSGREGGHGSNRGGFHPRAYEDSGSGREGGHRRRGGRHGGRRAMGFHGHAQGHHMPNVGPPEYHGHPNMHGGQGGYHAGHAPLPHPMEYRYGHVHGAPPPPPHHMMPGYTMPPSTADYQPVQEK